MFHVQTMTSKRLLLALASAGFVAVASSTSARAAGPQPWYERAGCLEAADAVANVRLTEAEEAIRALEKSRDADDVACSVYLRVLLADVNLAVHGETDRYLGERDRYIGRMFGFAKAHARFGARFADLEMEARMRRVRVLFERDDEMGAVGEARRAHRLLRARSKGPSSPTVEFVRGAMYSALGQAGTLGRMLLGMAGISGDPDEGYRSLMRVAAGDSVYRMEGLHLARQFAADLGDEDARTPLGSALDLGDRLVVQSSGNPQYAYDHAYTLLRRGEAGRGLDVLTPHLERLRADRDAWAPTMRAKLHYLATRCALGMGEVDTARAHRDAMASLGPNDYSGRLAGLTTALERAERQN